MTGSVSLWKRLVALRSWTLKIKPDWITYTPSTEGNVSHDKTPPINNSNADITVSQRVGEQCQNTANIFLVFFPFDVSYSSVTFCCKKDKKNTQGWPFLFYGRNTYCSDPVCFSSCSDFLLGTQKEDKPWDDQIKQAAVTKGLTQNDSVSELRG